MTFIPTPLTNLGFNELEKIFTKYFDALAIKHSYYNVFDNLLDMAINGFCINYSTDLMDIIRKRYTQDERYIFGEMIKIWILILDIKVSDDNDFYDWFGYYYEKNAMSKQRGFAQYFTPEVICKFMSAIVVDQDEEGKKIYEPACGSGRLNLSAHAINNRMYHVANDLDYTCAKMATLNFMSHGIKGVVTADDGLMPKTSFKGAFVINEWSAPSLRFIDSANEAYNYIHRKLGTDKRPDKEETTLESISAGNEYIVNADKKGQFNLFNF